MWKIGSIKVVYFHLLGSVDTLCVWFWKFKIKVIKPWYHYTSLSIHEMISPKENMVAKNCSNKSCWGLNFVRKTQWSACLFSPGVELGAIKIDMVQIFYCTEMGK